MYQWSKINWQGEILHFDSSRFCRMPDGRHTEYLDKVFYADDDGRDGGDNGDDDGRHLGGAD